MREISPIFLSFFLRPLALPPLEARRRKRPPAVLLSSSLSPSLFSSLSLSDSYLVGEPGGVEDLLHEGERDLVEVALFSKLFVVVEFVEVEFFSPSFEFFFPFFEFCHQPAALAPRKEALAFARCFRSSSSAASLPPLSLDSLSLAMARNGSVLCLGGRKQGTSGARASESAL